MPVCAKCITGILPAHLACMERGTAFSGPPLMNHLMNYIKKIKYCQHYSGNFSQNFWIFGSVCLRERPHAAGRPECTGGSRHIFSRSGAASCSDPGGAPDALHPCRRSRSARIRCISLSGLLGTQWCPAPAHPLWRLKCPAPYRSDPLRFQSPSPPDTGLNRPSDHR